MADPLPDDDPYHPDAAPRIEGGANLHQLQRWFGVMTYVNDHYDPDGEVYPTPVDHILHHGRTTGAADMPPEGTMATDTERWTRAQCLAATTYCIDYLARHPDHYPAIVPPRPMRAFTYRLPLDTVNAFHRACDRLGLSPLVTAAIALDAAFCDLDIEPDALDDAIGQMGDDLRNYGSLGTVIEDDRIDAGDRRTN